MPARIVNLVIGVWLFISAFVWPHTGQEFTNTWICGALAVIFAAGATMDSRVRYLNTALSIYLFIATLAFRHEMPGTLWNNLIAAVVIFFVSLVPSGAVTRANRTRVV